MSTTAPPLSRLVIAGTEAERVVWIQDTASLRDPREQDGLIEVAIAGQVPIHVALLEDEAVLIVTVRKADLWPLSCAVTPLLGAEEGQGKP